MNVSDEKIKEFLQWKDELEKLFRDEMQLRNKKMDLYEEKAQLTRRIIETAEQDAECLLGMLEQSRLMQVDVGEAINQFLYRIELLKQDKYLLDDGIIDFQTELYEYFEWYEEECHNMVDMYGNIDDPYFWSEEKEELEKLTCKFGFYELYARFVKWCLSNTPEDFEMFLQVLNDEFIEGFLCPVDREEYWKSEYTQFDLLNVDDRLKRWVIYVTRFFDVYGKYIEAFIDNSTEPMHSIDLFSTEIWARDVIFDRIRVIEEQAPDDPWFLKEVYEHQNKKNESWKQLLAGRNFAEPYYREDLKDDDYEPSTNLSTPPEIPEEFKIFFDLRWGTDLHKEYWQVCKPSLEEYFQLTRDLSDEEKIETGRCAYLELMQNIEAINITKWILKVLSKDNDDYKVVYKSLAKVQEKLIALVYDDSVEFEEVSVTEEISADIEQYKKQCILEITSRLIKFIANQDIEQLMQCKNDIIPLYSAATPWLTKTVEENIGRITEQIIFAVSKDNSFDSIFKNLQSRFGTVFSDDIIKTLATAEFLYDKYIVNSGMINDFDYSFISILYYQVLEKASNVLLYKSYIEKVSAELTINNLKDYFGEANCAKVFFDKRTKQKQFTIKESLELGPISYFLAETKSTESNIFKYIKSRYRNVKAEQLVELGKEIGKAAVRRNNAAHPGIIQYKTAVEDRVVVYDSSNSLVEVTELHDLFIKLISVLGLP